MNDKKVISSCGFLPAVIARERITWRPDLCFVELELSQSLDSGDSRASTGSLYFLCYWALSTSSDSVPTGMEFFWTLALLLIYSIDPTNGACERISDLKNGSIGRRGRDIVRFRCDRGYILQGPSVATCDRNGRVRGEKRFCAKIGCQGLENPENGRVFNHNFRADIMCNDGYVLVGSRTAFCDGKVWNTQLGSCRNSNHTANHSCDFESEDQCGWDVDKTWWSPWRRVSTVSDIHSLSTGPRHDHTFRNHSGGHYMRMETQMGSYGSFHLMSPIYPRSLSLKTACCFRFHYFMYGAGVDSLVASVKPVSMRVTDMWNNFKFNSTKFKITGAQGTEWLEHTITIDEMQEDFQVVFTATDARSRFGDIAIDDVKLMTGSECGTNGFTTTTEPPAPTGDTSEMPLVFDMMSCTGRCGIKSLDSKNSSQGLTMGCGCDESCLSYDNCCLDFNEECDKELNVFADDDPQLNTTTTSGTTTPTPTTTRATTTTSSTTTTTRRTTTPTTSTTTTTTRRTTTPTSTTPRPTTTTRKATTTRRTTTTKRPTTTTTRRTSTSSTPKTTQTTRKMVTTKKTTTTLQPTTTTKKVVVTTTTGTSTTAVTSTRTLPVSTSVGQKTTVYPTIITTKKMRNYTWEVDPQDISGHMDMGESAPNPALTVLFLLVGVIVVVILANVVHRWIVPLSGSRPNSEKAVSFRKAFQSLRKTRKRTSSDQALCDTDNEDGDYFEEMGVDIRSRTDL